MCTTSESRQIFNENHINFFNIKDESEGYDTITFEDYKITENYSNDIIKEEPVDYFEIVELTDIHPTKGIEDEEQFDRDFPNNNELCNGYKQTALKSDNIESRYKYKTEQCDRMAVKLKRTSSKCSFLNEKNFIGKDIKFKTEPNDDTTIITNIISVKELKNFFDHDHTYHKNFNTPILNNYDSEDDSQEDEALESKLQITHKRKHEKFNSEQNCKHLKLYKHRKKSIILKDVKINKSSSSESSEDSSSEHSNSTLIKEIESESDESMDEDEDGIQYKEVSPTKLNMKSRSPSEDDHSCHSDKFATSSDDHRQILDINSHENTEKIKSKEQISNSSGDIRINSAMDLKKCFEGSLAGLMNSSRKDKYENSMKFSESSDSDSEIISSNVPSQFQHSAINLRKPTIKGSAKITKKSSQFVNLSLDSSNSKLHKKSRTFNNSQMIKNSPKMSTNSQQTSKNLSQNSNPQQSAIVDLLTDSSESDSEQQKSSIKIKKLPQNANQILKCSECPMIFNDTLRLNRHKKTHQVPQFQCQNCLRKFKRKSMLSKHFCDIKCPSCPDICTCQMKDSKDCIICQKINFRYFVDYKDHMVTHHNEIVYCKICEKNNYTLFKHKQLGHDVVRSYKCTECTSILKSKEQLEYHMEIHAKNFSCSKCSKIFTRRYLLKQHEMTHDNPKLFHCEICDKNFQRKFCLDNHRKVIHGDKIKEKKYLNQLKGMNGEKSIGWIRCDFCPALFRNGKSHQRHLDQSH